MKKLFFALLLASVATLSCAVTLTGRVVGVSDGDTLTLLDSQNQQHKIRLSGIDAPESGQAFGANSKKALSDCAFGKEVVVETDKQDRYSRSIGRVVSGGVDCNLRQVSLGFAWHYVKYAKERPFEESAAYSKADAEARVSKRGLWVDPNAVAPWDYRKDKKAAR